MFQQALFIYTHAITAIYRSAVKVQIRVLLDVGSHRGASLNIFFPHRHQTVKMPVCAESSCKKQSDPQHQQKQEREQEQHQEHQGRDCSGSEGNGIGAMEMYA